MINFILIKGAAMKEKIHENIMSSWRNIKNNISKFIHENNVHDLKGSVQKIVADAKKDISNLATKDINSLKRKIKAEKKQVEQVINQVIPAEVKKAKKFVQDQKREISRLQKKLESIVPVKKIAKKKVVRKATSKKTTRIAKK